MERVGLLAGVGALPAEFLRAAKLSGAAVVVIAVVPGVDARLASLADAYYEISCFKPDTIIKTLLAEGVREVTMLGKVTKEWLFKGAHMPDWRAIRLLNRLRKADWKDDTITLAIVEELAKDGITVLDQTKYLKPLMPGPQIFTKRKPTEEELADISFGFRMAKALGAIDAGQTVVVKHLAVMALEAIEGTDACILRGGKLARGEAVVVKTAKPGQDMRFDMPTVGMRTLKSMTEGGCRVLAIEAYRTFFAEMDEVIAEADRRGMTILATEGENA